jgi:hypothetical protein
LKELISLIRRDDLILAFKDLRQTCIKIFAKSWVYTIRTFPKLLLAKIKKCHPLIGVQDPLDGCQQLIESHLSLGIFLHLIKSIGVHDLCQTLHCKIKVKQILSPKCSLLFELLISTFELNTKITALYFLLKWCYLLDGHIGWLLAYAIWGDYCYSSFEIWILLRLFFANRILSIFYGLFYCFSPDQLKWFLLKSGF